MSFRSILLVILMSLAAAAGAVTPVWTGDIHYLPRFGFAVLEVDDDADLALVNMASSSAAYVRGYRVGPTEDAAFDLEFSELDGSEAYYVYGSSIAPVGDVDGDGHDDLLVTAPLSQGSFQDEYPAMFYLYRGGPAMDTVADLVGEIWAPEYSYAAQVAVGGGDWNGDGYADFAISHSTGVLLYFGGPEPDAVPDLAIAGPRANSSFRDTIIFADLDGDGHADLASGMEGTFGDSIKVYLGGPDADDQPDWFLPRDHLAASLAAGNVNDDGIDDLVVVQYGQVSVYYGGPQPGPAPDLVFTSDPERFVVHQQSHAAVIETDPTDPGGEIWVAATWDNGLAVYDGQGGSTDTPMFFFPPDPGGDAGDDTRYFAGMADFDGDGADEFIVRDEAYRMHVYDDLFFDSNDNGVPDNDEAGVTLPDCDGNGLADPAEAIVWPHLDCNGDLALDQCQLDTHDCDGNGEIDSCELAGNPWLDCNSDDILDSCQTLPASYDCDGNGVADCLELHLNPSWDCDDNGRLDVCDYESDVLERDCNGNGVKDYCEIAAQPSLDCNGDGTLDMCQVFQTGYDCDNNGVLDVCHLPGELATDCNDDGRADTCEIAEVYAADCNGNGWVDACEDEPWTEPCRPAPYIGVYFDAELTLTSMWSGGMPAMGSVWIAVRDLPADLGGAVDRWEVSITVPEGFILYGGELPEGSQEFGPGATDWLVYSGQPLTVNEDGDLVLVRMDYLRMGVPASASSFDLAGSAASDVWRSHPILHDEAGGFVRVLDARPGWVYHTFADCNGNGVDDLLDVQNGTSEDVNQNNVPDECEQITASPVPAVLSLGPPSPNPFNPATSVRFALPRTGLVRLAVYDYAGRRVRTLLDGVHEAGHHDVDWRGRDDRGALVPSGTYLLRLEADGKVLTRKMALLK